MTYSPVAKIPTVCDDKDDDVIFSIKWNILLKHNCSLTGLRGAIAYLIGEATDNCKQHSESSFYWIGTQLFVERRKFSICIVDLGKTVLGSYQSAGFDEVVNIKDALDAALQGKSTKLLDEGRGYGIRTSKSLLCKGLAGTYSIWSGQAVYLNKAGKESWSKLNSVYHFPGTVVSIELPVDIPQSFNLYDYVS
jgi:hypothetical protein